MRVVLYSFGALVGGLVLGWGAGWMHMRDHRPPEPQGPPLPGVEAAPVFEAQTALFADMAAAQTAAQAQELRQVSKAAQPAGVLAEAAVKPSDPESKEANPVIILPHGPGFFAELDLAAAGLQSVPVYAGSLARDGLANPAQTAKGSKIGALRGPLARVELLHIGFQKDALPAVVHVKTPEGLEGLVVVRVAKKGQPESVIAIRPLPSAAEPAAPYTGSR